MKKRILALALCICALFAAPMQAAAYQVPTETVAPYMLLIKQADAELTLDGDSAEIYVYAEGVASADKVEIEAELQVKEGSSWRYCADWSVSKSSDYASLSKTRAVVEGNTYRIKAVVTVWSGSQSETQTIYSSQVSV
ncbi:MAG: hypothetical protein IJ452_04870 [Butyricicoccus sp.]|nr:hypothetical protein [Butyricicoccus sp.]